MRIKLIPKFIIAFLALTFILGEAHEIVHTSIGRLICGCWGERDFNAWGLCEGCFEAKPFAIISTFAGPIFTFIMIWIGTFLIRRDTTDKQKAVGFSLIFANLPFARILTAVIGGGDEVFGFDVLLRNTSLAWIIGLVFILLNTLIPLFKAYKLIDNKRKLGWFLLFFLSPTFIYLLLVLGLMNTLLMNGFLSNYWILGSPTLVSIWTIFWVVIFAITKHNIYKLVDK